MEKSDAKDSDTAEEPSLADAFAEFAARRRALLSFLGALAVVAVVQRAAPYLAQYTTLYDTLLLDWSWVLLVWALACLYSGAGFLSHRQDGMPQRFPLLAIGASTLTVVFICTTLLDVGAEWTAAQSMAALVIFAFSVGIVLVGIAGYTELWRSLFNRQIVRSVLATLPGGAEASRGLAAEDITHVLATSTSDSRFRSKVGRQIKNGDWGSLHCLTIVQEAFEIHRNSVHSVASGAIPSDNYDTCLSVGADLLLYLSLRWPASYMSTEYVRWLRLELVRELLTMWRQGTHLQQLQHRQRASEWMSELKTAQDPYHRFLALCISLAGAETVQSPSATLKSVMAATDLYRQVSHGVELPTGIVTDVRDICSNTWLVLSERVLPRQACVDVWMAMRAHKSLPPLIPAVESTYNGESLKGTEMSVLSARQILSDHYSEWSRRIHKDWNDGLSQRRLLIGE